MIWKYAKHFELLRVAFKRDNVETSRYIVVGVVNTLSIDWTRESIDRPEGWLSKVLALSVKRFTPSVDRSIASCFLPKANRSNVSSNQSTKRNLILTNGGQYWVEI